MRQTFSTLIAIALLVGLGALAVLALPNGQMALNPAPVAVAAQVVAGPEAPLGTNRYNVIAMPLDTTNQFTNAGQPFNAAGLAAIVGPGVQQVLKWNANTNSHLQYIPGLGGDNFNLSVGGVYWLELDSTANNIVSFVGNVPTQGSVTFALVRPAAAGCRYNDISIPLERSDITTPQQLANSIGNVEQVLQWSPATNTYQQYLVGLGGDNFTIKIGYPYHVCLQAGGNTTWP